MEIERIGVVGAGTMGSGIAQVCAGAGYEVRVMEVDREPLDAGLERVESGLRRWLDKGTIDDEELEEIRSRLHGTLDPMELRPMDLIVEAVVEDEGVKREVFGRVDELCPERTILASNTSSISITRLAAATGRPDRVIGMHFFNPVPLMSLVEIVRGVRTGDETHRAVVRLAESLDKTPVTVGDVPGFVSNRVLMPMINEAITCLNEGVASAEEIDTVMKLGMNHPIGPLRLADFIGLDVCLSIMEVLHEGYGDPKYRPCPLLRRLVDAGQLGRKSGEGFFAY